MPSSRNAWRMLLKTFGFFSFIFLVAFTCLAQEDDASPLPPPQIQVGGELGRRIDLAVNPYFLSLQLEKELLPRYQKKTATNGNGGLGIWLEAAVRLAALTKNKDVLARKNQLIDAAIAAQESDGYLGIMIPKQRMQSPDDLAEMAAFVQAFVTDYRLFGNKKSLEAARKLGDYLLGHEKKIPREKENFFGLPTYLALPGWDRAMFALARETNEIEYYEFWMNKLLNPETIRIESESPPGRPGNLSAQVNRCVALQELQNLSHQPPHNLPPSVLSKIKNPNVDANQYFDGSSDMIRERIRRSPMLPVRKTWIFLTDKNGMAVTGSWGQWGAWTNDQDGTGDFGELVVTANTLRLLHNVPRQGIYVSNFGDLMERIVYNGLFAAQSPDGTIIRSFTPFEGNRDRTSSPSYNPAQFCSILAELADSIYQPSQRGTTTQILVNIYTESSATLVLEKKVNPYATPVPPAEASPEFKQPTKKDKKQTIQVKLRQETDYPNSGKIILHVDPESPQYFDLLLRIPRWCSNPSIRINNDPNGNEMITPGSIHYLSREWKPGDRIVIDFPMEWRFIRGVKRQEERVAVMRGPVVFTLNPLRKENRIAGDWRDFQPSDLTLVSESIEGPLPDQTVRPGGMACRIKAFRPSSPSDQPDTQILLTEFPDPNGRAIYFHLRDRKRAVPDEILGSERDRRFNPEDMFE